MSELEQRIHSLTMRIRNAGAKAARDGTIQGNQFPDIGAITDELKVVNDEVDEAIAALIEREVQEFAERVKARYEKTYDKGTWHIEQIDAELQRLQGE